MADTNAGALCEAGRRDAQALTVTGRRRAHTGSIRRAVKALTRTAKAVTPETPDGAWLRDNQTLARTAASDAAAALRHAHTLRASGAQAVLHACCAGLLHACGNALTPKAAQAYLAGFQDVLPLETAELALLVPGLQAAAVCALADTYAHDGAAAPALFTSLRALGTAAWAALTERCDRVGRILARDPAGVYPTMDAASRTRYRQTVARLARRTGRTEINIAEDVLARAQSGEGARRHVGWFLLREVLGAPEKRRGGAWYIAAVVMGTLALSLLLGFATGSVSGAVLLLIPVSEVVKGLLDAVLLRVTKPRFVPRLALRRGIPPEGRTLCVIAALLTSPDDAHALCARLEEYALCNRDAGEQLLFGLLADLPEADMEHAPIDPAILRAAREEIEALNARYGGRFYLFTRERVQTPDGKWSAWERKRGALLRLAQLLCGEADAMHCAAGDAAAQGLIYALGHPIVHPADARVRYHSSVLPGLAAAVVQTVLRLILLPWEAVLNASAIVTALWRMTVSHRDLLQWQTAAQRAAKRDGLGAYLRALWPASALGLLTAVLTPSPTGLAAGIVWTLSPFVLAALGAPNAPGAAPLQHAAQRELLGWAKATWRYFETFCTAGEHYLPPDNVQTQPPTGTAHRTSPTNMGFALLSALCAHALGIDNGRGLTLAEQMLTTMEQLPRWNGHFYNWYHTCTLRPMPPLYVSTVDSGNCAAALLAAANALRGWGQDALAARAQALCDGMDFALLYDPQRRLMHIGIDTGSGKRSEGYYDLLESEARLTSYFAVARGDVPREHWRALSRAQVQHERYRGCVSWSGSVFEYLMPELFLPPQRDSLLWESAKFCLRVQRRRVRTGQPWGVSESAYFALDSALNYRYKAHGCAALAMQPDMDRELVLSPYSAFLALAVAPRAAVRDLRRFAARGLPGQYGFREALDCTRARTGGGGQIVHCVMAHHQGMSLLSACNALCGGQVQRWFLADPAMRAHMSLLSERLPLGAPALRRRPEAQRGKPRRRALPDCTVEGTGVDAEVPRCTLLSNGTYCLAVTEAGQSFARWHALSVCRRGTRSDPAAAPMLSLETGGVCTPLLPGTADAARWRFTVRAAQFSTRHGSVTAVQTFTVPERVNGEVRALTLSSPDGIDGTVRLTFEAVLAPWEDYVNHPAFARLGFQSVLRRNALLLRRLGRGGKPETWLCAVCDRQADFYAEGAIPGWLRAGYVQVRVAVHTPPDTPWRVRFALGVGAHEDDAFAAAQRALVLPPESAAALPGTLAAQYGMTDAELEGAMAHISPLLFPTAAPDAAAEQLKRPALWAHGISGDLPVWCARPEAQVLRQWALLRALGIGCDLALCSSDGGDYLQPTRTKVRGALAALDLTHCLDAPGGVHLVPEDAFADVAAAAAIRPGMAHTRCTLPLLPPPGDRRTMPTGSDVHWDADGTVAFTGLPPRAWSNVLTNGRFGFLATDAGTGHLWYRNAHTGRINRWLCDPWVLRGTETLRMATRAGAVSLFDDDGRARVEYGFGWAAWERTVDGMSVHVTAFVPEDANARVLLIECAGRARITWHTDLVCAGRDADAPAVVTAYSGGVFTAGNARADTPLRVCAAAGMPLTGWTCDRFSFLRGQMDRRAGAGLSPCFALEGVVERQGVLVCGCDTRANLLRLTQPDEAVRALHRVRERWLGAVSRLWITTPDAAMNRYLGGWAAYQTLCCRLMARTSLYQNGGAFGFRDQLQDAVNLLLLDSKPAREQIGYACAHQFSAGDVCHWWHAGFGVEHGVRTRISDDLLWLPWAVCEYAQKTGDTQILSAEYPFLAGEELEENERDRYQPLTPGAETGTVLEHCRRAFMRVLARGVGAHGLLHIGTGDWNDAFDRVGAQGRGESVWLTWFFAVTARKFAALIGGHAAEQLTLAADRCTRAAEAAWDGAWYRRGYYDDGQPLGSEKSGECRIDAIAQAFAAFDTHADPAHVHCALTSAVEQLFDREHNVVRLFDPPITRRTPETGYVRSYGAGLRENGGQYTHGALWLAMALLRTGRTDEGAEILRAVLPAAHDPARYEGEPYVLAADVAAGDNAGAAGWTWYTGAAGWYLRVAAEELLGLHLRGGVLYPEPRLPDGWPECAVRWRDGAGLLHTIRLRPDSVTVDEKPYDGGGIGKKRPKPYSQDR